MKIKDLPDSSKPRERFLKHGPEVLSDAELFAVILRTGTVGENVMEVSNKLISKFGLVNLFDCSLKELEEVRGIGKNKAMQLLAMAELGKRYNKEKRSNIITKISCAQEVFNLFKEDLEDKKQEHFYIVMLNNQNNIIGKELLTKGILDASIIHPREIFKSAIRNSSSKIILVHNHPSGNPEPSREDLDITKRLMEAGEIVDIKIIDHVIIGGDEWWSWAEENKI